MKQLAVFIKKEIRHILRDPRTLLLLIGMPIAQLLLFGFAISTEIRNSGFAVYDPSQDPSTQAIIEKLDASEYFTNKKNLANPSQINDVLTSGIVPIVIVFPPQFAQKIARNEALQIQIVADGADPNTATQVVGYASSIIQDALNSQNRANISVVPSVRMLYNPAMKGAYNFVPGVLGMILMLICAMMTSIAIVREKERGNMELLLVSPMPPLLILLSKIIPYFLLSMLNFFIVISLAVTLMDVPVAGSVAALFLCAFLFILSALAMGILISTKTSSQVAAMLVSGMIFMMPVMLLSGMMFPTENMPMALQWVSYLIPARWFISAARSIMIQGVGLAGVITEISVLGAMAFLFTLISLSQFKNRLE